MPTSSEVLSRRKMIKATSSDDLPDEMLLEIFFRLDVKSLLQAGCVCHRWKNVSESSLLWKDICKQYAAYKEKAIAKFKTENLNDIAETKWKQKFLQKCRKTRNKKFLSLLKINPYTGVAYRMDELLWKLGVSFQLCFVDCQHQEQCFEQSRRKVLSSSTVLQWHSLSSFPLWTSVVCMKIYALTPLMFSKSSNEAVVTGPRERKLICEESLLTTKQAAHGRLASDESISILVTKLGFFIALWKDTNDVAFIAYSLHNHNLLKKCLLSTSHLCYVTDHVPIIDDVDTNYGLHGYQCHLHMHTLGTSVWEEKFSCLYCRNRHEISIPSEFLPWACGGVIELDLAPIPTAHLKTTEIKWRTELFNGAVANTTMLDVTLIDSNKEMFWNVSRPLASHCLSLNEFRFDDNGMTRMFKLSEDVGCIMIITSGNTAASAKLISVKLFLRLDSLNKWFGTNY